MAGQGDAYLRSVLGGGSGGSGAEGSAGAENVVGGGGAPGAGPGASAEVGRAAEDARRAVAEGHTPWSVAEGAGSALLDASATMTQDGGYRFDPDAIAAKITEWEGLRDRIAEHRRLLLDAASAATPPSNDPPAVQQAKAVVDSLTKAAEHAESMRVYAREFISSLKKANGTYVENEDDTVTALQANAPGGDAAHGTGDLFG